MLGPEAEAMVACHGGRSLGSTCRRLGRSSAAESGGLSPFLWVVSTAGRQAAYPLPELTQPAAVSLNRLWSSYGSPPSVTITS
jgi:hypothetical protein